MNEFLFFVHLGLVFTFTLFALRLGKEALIAWIVLQSILANLFVLKQISLFSLQASCTDVFVLGAMLGLNLLQEYFGKLCAKRTILFSFSGMFVFVILSKIHLLYQATLHDHSQIHYEAIFSSTPRLFTASLVCFFCTQQFDVRFFAWMKRRFSNVPLGYRTVSSLLLSQVLDTVLFSFLGLYGLVSNLWSLILFSFTIKALLSFCTMPFTIISKKIVITTPPYPK